MLSIYVLCGPSNAPSKSLLVDENLTLKVLLTNQKFDAFNFSMQLFDGHNGSTAATYVKENLLNNILSAIPSDLSRDEWLAALPRALVAGFVKTDKDFQEKGMSLEA